MGHYAASVWVDTHAHLQLAAEPPRRLLERADQVDWLIVPGIDAASSRAALDLAADYPDRVLASVGLHPHHASRWPEEETELTELAVRAESIGETGLDFYRDLSPRNEQVEALRQHVKIATELSKPLVVHCRDAFEALHDMLEETGYGSRTVLHCWTGGPRWTRRFLDLDATFSFAGPITYKGGESVRRAAAVVPPDHVLVETDTPYLTPPRNRSQPNEPANVAAVGRALADVWKWPVEKVAEVTSRNAGRVFGR